MNFQQTTVSRRAALIGIASLAAACAPMRFSNRALTLDDVIHRNTTARGGKKALDRVRTVLMDAEIVENGQTLVGRYAANVAGQVRIDIYVGGKNIYAEGVDPGGVWRWTGGPELAQPSKAEGAANALTNGAENHLFGWHRFAGRGHRLALMPPATIAGVPYKIVEVRYTTGHVSYFYVDPSSWLAVRRRDDRAYHPDNDQTKKHIESQYFDFQPVEGVIASHSATDVDLDTGKILSTNRTLARRINPLLSADYFDRNRRAPAAWIA